MSHREIGFVALGRCLAVERYLETRKPCSATQLASPGPDRAGGDVRKADSSSGSRAPARG
jgi:hypothetical protein